MYTQQVSESYWKTCWKWGWLPYPCKRYRTITQYCYDFSSVGDHCYVGIESHYGCEAGKQYHWYDGCVGWFTAYFGYTTVCFDHVLESDGSCKEGESLPKGGDTTRPVQNMGDDVAIGGLAYTIKPRTAEEAKKMPLYVRSTCKPCITLRIVVVVLVLFGIYLAFLR